MLKTGGDALEGMCKRALQAGPASLLLVKQFGVVYSFIAKQHPGSS